MTTEKITIEYTEHRDADGIVHRKEVGFDTPKDSHIRTKEVEPFQPGDIASRLANVNPSVRSLIQKMGPDGSLSDEALNSLVEASSKRVYPPPPAAYHCSKCSDTGYTTIPQYAGKLRLQDAAVPCTCKRKEKTGPLSQEESRARNVIFGDKWDAR